MESKKMNRRHFIKKGALGAVSTAVSVSLLKMNIRADQPGPKIIYRTLGKSKLSLPLISFGVMNSDKPELIKKSLQMGIKHLDTANLYLRGNSETAIGNVVKEMSWRDKVYISTKIYLAREREKNVFLTEGSTDVPGATEENFNKTLGVSLQRLQTDYVDILYLHSIYSPEMVNYEPTLSALQKAKKEGKARLIGVTTHANEPEVVKAAVDTGVMDVILVTYNYLQKNKDQIKEVIKYAASRGVGIIGMKTFGGSRMLQDQSIKINHKAALKWVLNDQNVTTVIPGMTTFDQLDLNLSVMDDLKLTQAEEKELAMTAALPGLLYCQNCRTCLSSCPKGVEIPQLMRAFMYDHGYQNTYQAQLTISHAAKNRGLDVCHQCPVCTAKCVNGIAISDRIRSLIKTTSVWA